ncbi:hypothetical protein Tco_0471494 [Tanacetum coccineum]
MMSLPTPLEQPDQRASPPFKTELARLITQLLDRHKSKGRSQLGQYSSECLELYAYLWLLATSRLRRALHTEKELSLYSS